MKNKVYGILAEFKSPLSLLKAAKQVNLAGYTKYDTYTPFPIHGMDKAMGLKPSPLGIFVFCGGAFGLLVGFFLQAWVATQAYPLIVSGKPLFSFQAFIPVTFELMVLFSAFTTVFGMFIMNRLPSHYHPFFTSNSFSKATSHSFFMGIEVDTDNFDINDTKKFLTKIGGFNLEVIEETQQ